MASVKHSIVRLHIVPAAALFWMMAAVLIVGCNDTGTNGDGPLLRQWLQKPSCSWAGDHVYFEYVGDTVNAAGVYRVDLVKDTDPELIAIDGLLPAVSPCGSWLAYLRYGNLWIRDVHGDHPAFGASELLIPVDSSGGIDALAWRGCSAILYKPVWQQGLYQIELSDKSVSQVFSGGRNPTAPKDGAFVVFTLGQALVTLREDDLDSLILFGESDLVRQPKASPNGGLVVYSREWETDSSGVIVAGLVVETVNTTDGAVERITQLASQPNWTADGRIVYVNFEPEHYYELWITDSLGLVHESFLSYRDF